MCLIHNIVPSFAPKLLALGYYAGQGEHFILFSFHNLENGLLDIPRVASAVAQLHGRSRHCSPNGKFGFPITTYNGTLA